MTVPARQSSPTLTWRTTPTQTVRADGVDFAYRELGPRGGTPVVLLHHLTAVLDDWDPRLVDGLAAHHHVIAFDNRGVGATTGRVPSTVGEMATDAVTFLRALGHEQVDLFGFSLGGGVAQYVLLGHPDLVRRAVLAGTGPAGAGGLAKMPVIVGGAYLKAALTRNDPRAFLFFGRDAAGKRASAAYLARLAERTTDRDQPVSMQARVAQLRAIVAAGLQQPHDLSTVTAPVLVANGDHDLMVASAHTHDLGARIPGAETVVYPDSGHGGIFQNVERFVPTVLDFLARP